MAFCLWSELGSDGLPLAYTSSEIYDKMVELRMDLRREKQQLAELNLFFGCCKRELGNTGARGAPDDSGTTAAVFSCSVQLQCSAAMFQLQCSAAVLRRIGNIQLQCSAAMFRRIGKAGPPGQGSVATYSGIMPDLASDQAAVWTEQQPQPTIAATVLYNTTPPLLQPFATIISSTTTQVSQCGTTHPARRRRRRRTT